MSRQEHANPPTEGAGSAGDQVLEELMQDPSQWALFLDIDGTLIDLAETPESIVVPAGLPADLHRLSARLGGALALVTGRALPFADQLFRPYVFPIAGLHGSERRDATGMTTRVEVGAEFETLKAALAREAQQWPGVLIENKGAAVAAHYRRAPEQREVVEAAMERYLDMAGDDFTLQHGKMVVEIRPARASKGHALMAYLNEAPFQDRKPIAIGDDVTDEAMFRVVNELGGHSIRISETPAETVAQSTLPSASYLRSLIHRFAAETVRPE